VAHAVERAAGRKLDLKLTDRRAGDPAAIVAEAGRARSVLGWQPRHDNLDGIVASALAWERHLIRRNARPD
jgi:UDP-glucose 4-epimerase